MPIVDISEYGKLAIFRALLRGWQEVTNINTPNFVLFRFRSKVVELDGKAQFLRLEEMEELAYQEGIKIAKETVG